MKTDEIKNFLSTIKKKMGILLAGLNFQNTIILVISMTVLLLANYWVAANIMGAQDLFVHWFASKNLFFQGMNPYSQDSFNLITQNSQSILVLPSKVDFHFLNPLYALFVFFPLSLIPNFIITRAVWLIINEVLLFFAIQSITRILHWPSDLPKKRLFIIFGLFFFYSIVVLLQGGEQILLFFFFLMGLESITKQNYIEAGILLSFLSINPQMMLLPILVLSSFLLIRNGWAGLVWLLISLSLLFTASFILQSDWPVQYLKAIFINAPASGMSLPGTAIVQWIKNPIHPFLWNLLALLAIGLIIYELLIIRMLRFSPLWMIGLVLTLNPFIIIQPKLGYMCFLLLPLGLIFQQWEKRNIEYGRRILHFSFIAFTFFLPILGFLTQSLAYEKTYPFIFYLLPVLLVLLNLYWIRGWVVNVIPD
jgi:hypothetical protein